MENRDDYGECGANLGVKGFLLKIERVFSLSSGGP